MFRKKRWFIFTVFAALILLLAACGGNQTDEAAGGSEGETSEESSGQKITIFQSKVEISEQLEALAKEYTKKQV